VIDARGLSCPLPILRTRRALRDVPAGTVFEVLSTDPGSVRDFQAFCRQTDNPLLDWREDDDGVFHYRIRKGE
jgi:tRNA 2-thiouridine synthesizing protein A